MDNLCAAYCMGYGLPVRLVESDEVPTHRAHRLLEAHLSPDEVRRLGSGMAIAAVGGATGTLYRVGPYADVSAVVDGRYLPLCSTIPGLPYADRVLAALLTIRSVDGEQLFLDNAYPQGGLNVWGPIREAVRRDLEAHYRHGSLLVWCDPSRGWFRARGGSTIYDGRSVVRTHRFDVRAMRIEPVASWVDRAREAWRWAE